MKKIVSLVLVSVLLCGALLALAACSQPQGLNGLYTKGDSTLDKSLGAGMPEKIEFYGNTAKLTNNETTRTATFTIIEETLLGESLKYITFDFESDSDALAVGMLETKQLFTEEGNTITISMVTYKK